MFLKKDKHQNRHSNIVSNFKIPDNDNYNYEQLKYNFNIHMNKKDILLELYKTDIKF